MENKLHQDSNNITSRPLSAEVQEIINYRPHWIIRRGNVIFSVVLLLLFSFTFMIEYPDTVNGTARLVSKEPPVIIKTVMNGQLYRLMINSGTDVVKEQPLALLRCNADHSEVLKLYEWLSESETGMKKGKLMEELSRPSALFKNLGDLQAEFENFKRIKVKTAERLKEMLSGYNNPQRLGGTKIQAVYPGKIQEQQREYLASLSGFKSSIQNWMNKYIITAKTGGKVNFISLLQENQLLDSGDLLFYIQPRTANYFVEIRTGQTDFGKISTGQQVIVKLAGYPAAEYGSLKAVITDIVPFLNERDSFILKAELVNGLTTSYEKDIHFVNRLSGTAKIITEKRRLSDRIFGQLRGMAGR